MSAIQVAVRPLDGPGEHVGPELRAAFHPGGDQPLDQ